MDGLQAAVLLVKLKYIENWNSLRRKNAELYDELLLDVKDIFVPSTHSKALSVFHIYAIKLKDKNKRDALLSFL